MEPWSLSKSLHLTLMLASSFCKARISNWFRFSSTAAGGMSLALVQVAAAACGSAAVGSRELTLPFSALLRSSFTELLTSVTVLRIFSCSQNRTWTTKRSGKRSFWEACVQASRERRWQLRIRHMRFLSCSDRVGCICSESTQTDHRHGCCGRVKN